MNKVIPLIAFSVLFLVSVGAQNVYATDGFIEFDPNDCTLIGGGPTDFPENEELKIRVGPADSVIEATGSITQTYTTQAGDDFVFFDPSLGFPKSGPYTVTCTHMGVTSTVEGNVLPLSVGICGQNTMLNTQNQCVPDLSQICSTGTMIEPTQMMTCIAQSMSSIIGGELLDIDTVSLFIGAIGVNPVITGLVAITMGGVAAQAIWYVNSRRKNE